MGEGEARVGADCESARNGDGPSAQLDDHQLSERKAVAAGLLQGDQAARQAWGGLHSTEADAAAAADGTAETNGKGFFFGVLILKKNFY